MRLIDDEGNLALVGVNVVDAVVLALLAVVVAGGVAVGADQLDDESQQLTVVVESTERIYVSDALAQRDNCDRGPAIEHVLVAERYFNQTRALEVERLRITAVVEAVPTREGWQYDDEPLYIGGAIELDLCRLRIDGTVVDIQEGGDESS